MNAKFMTFVDKGIVYLGIPDDVIVAFLNRVAETRKTMLAEKHQDLIEKLGLVSAMQKELEGVTQEQIYACVMEQLVATQMKTQSMWMHKNVWLNENDSTYHYTSENLFDLNAKFQAIYTLPILFRILSARYASIKLVKRLLPIPKSKHSKVMDMSKHAISIPKEIVDNVVNRLHEIPVLKDQDSRSKVSSFTRGDQEIVGLILLLLERQDIATTSTLKMRIEESTGDPITWDQFNTILDIMKAGSIITIDDYFNVSKVKKD